MKGMAIKTIKKYLPHLNVRQGETKSGLRLPAIYSSLYRFEELIINKNPYLVINVKARNLGPRQFKKHAKIIKEKVDYPQIWFVHDLHFHKVQRMIENGLDFIVENKQVYLPSLNIAIKPEKAIIKAEHKNPNGLTINILIRQIIKGDLEGKNKQEIAEIFKVNQMTIGRAIAPLISLELCDESKVGVAKILRFKGKSELWHFLKSDIKTPIIRTVFLKKCPKKIVFSGITALSQAGMLSDDQIPTYAIYKKNYNTNFTQDELALEDDAQAKLEVWDREAILTDGKRINPVDCYLVLKKEDDERVKIELEALLKKIGLKYD